MFESDIRIDVRPRLHLGLLSLHQGAPRMNGGIGFAIHGPVAEIHAREADQLTIVDARHNPMSDAELVQLVDVIGRFASTEGMTRHAAIRIGGAMRTHVGMGSATAIRLGSVEALALLNKVSIPIERIVAASGRGGTSGVGVNTYFTGGLICDLGRPNDGHSYAPSSKSSGGAPPLALPVVALPAWPMLVCLPRSIRPKTQKEEADFFNRTAPLPPIASYEASYIALFDIYAAAVEGDYDAFCRGVNRIQSTAWKKAERAEYGEPLWTIADRLSKAGADCVGMSSLGPMLFCFADPVRLTAIERLADALHCEMHRTWPANVGRNVIATNA